MPHPLHCRHQARRALAAVASVLAAAAALAQAPAAPVVFNAPRSARAGDIVGLQGENFGDNPTVLLRQAPGEAPIPLALVNRFGTGWVSARIPASATGAIVVQVGNGDAMSAPVKLNAAIGHHLDALQITPGGQFRLFGRNLLLPGHAPTVTVDGLPAAIDTGRSDEHMLVLTAPAQLRSTPNARIEADNGNGTGPAWLDRQIEVVGGAAGDPFGLGVGWSAGFARLASKTLNASAAACNGANDDTAAIQSAIDQLAGSGGGIVQLPPGNCRLAGSVKLRSRVVLQGAGRDRTLLRYESDYPLWGRELDLTGVRELTLHNMRGRIESPLLQRSTRVFFQNVRFDLAGGIQMFLTQNRNMAVTGCEFLQPRNPSGSGPYYFGDTGGLHFVGNTTVFADGSPNFARVHDAYLAGNRFTRDARDNQNSRSVIHSLPMDFAHRVAIVGNTFDLLGGPITNKTRNDGETLLTEGGGGERTENVGTVAGAGASTLSYASNLTINTAPFFPGQIPENYGIAIVGGRGAGQSRRVVSHSAGTLAVDRPWDVLPDTGSRFATFVWGLEKSLIKGNTLIQNPRGIWLYQTAVRDVDVVGNTIREGGGIYLRSAQNLKERLFVPMYGVRIADNTVTNTTRQWPSYVRIAFVRMDVADFGIGTIGIEVRNNTVWANSPNLVLAQEEAGSAEGFIHMALFEGPAQALARDQTRLLGTIFQNNTCVACATSVVVREGARGTVQDGNVNSAAP